MTMMIRRQGRIAEEEKVELTMRDRNRIRRKQDNLISLARDTDTMGMRVANEHRAPTGHDMVNLLWPEWEGQIDTAIKVLRGVPA